nr:transmembrane protein 270 [Cavia porcellus]
MATRGQHFHAPRPRSPEEPVCFAPPAQLCLRWVARSALLGNHLVLGFLALPRCLCWHLAYLITWTTCLASHLLQAAFEHTTQLVQAQGSSGSLSRSLLPVSSSTLEGQALLQKPENPGQ